MSTNEELIAKARNPQAPYSSPKRVSDLLQGLADALEALLPKEAASPPPLVDKPTELASWELGNGLEYSHGGYGPLPKHYPYGYGEQT